MAAGYDKGFTLLPEAVKEYCRILQTNDGYYEWKGRLFRS